MLAKINDYNLNITHSGENFIPYLNSNKFIINNIHKTNLLEYSILFMAWFRFD